MPRRVVAFSAAAATLVLLGLLVAATSSPTPLTSRPSRSVPPYTPPEIVTSSTTTTTTVPTGTGTGWYGFDPSGIIAAMISVLVVGTVALLVAGALAALRALLARSRPTLHTGTGADAAPTVPEELLAAARAQLDRLSGGTPRNAIVAAWVDLEGSAAAAGLPRDPAETSSEYTSRVLAGWSVRPEALGDLATLYREARFSTHELTEEHRARALTALAALLEDLRRARAEQAVDEPPVTTS